MVAWWWLLIVAWISFGLGVMFWAMSESGPEKVEEQPELRRYGKAPETFGLHEATTSRVNRAAGPCSPSGDARQQVAECVVDHLEESGFEIDEKRQVPTERPPT
jgi:hypothetical protein